MVGKYWKKSKEEIELEKKFGKLPKQKNLGYVICSTCGERLRKTEHMGDPATWHHKGDWYKKLGR